MKYEENQGYGEERKGGAGISHSSLENPKTSQIWKWNMDNRNGYIEEREVGKMSLLHKKFSTRNN